MHTFSPLSTKPVLVERKRRAPVSPGTTGLIQWFRASGHLIGVVVVGGGDDVDDFSGLQWTF